MQWPGQTTPATPMQWPGAQPTTTAPLGGVPETIAPTAPTSSPWGDSADSGGGGGLLWGVLGVGALVAVVAWQMRSRQQERERAATRLRGEELRQDMTESRVKRLDEGPDWVRLRVAPGARISYAVFCLKKKQQLTFPCYTTTPTTVHRPSIWPSLPLTLCVSS